jgi:hypothetical protein
VWLLRTGSLSVAKLPYWVRQLWKVMKGGGLGGDWEMQLSQQQPAREALGCLGAEGRREALGTHASAACWMPWDLGMLGASN